MNIIKVNNQYINLDNVAQVDIETAKVSEVTNGRWWYAQDNSAPDIRESLIARIQYIGSDGYEMIVDAEPLRDYLTSIALDLATPKSDIQS